MTYISVEVMFVIVIVSATIRNPVTFPAVEEFVIDINSDNGSHLTNRPSSSGYHPIVGSTAMKKQTG